MRHARDQRGRFIWISTRGSVGVSCGARAVRDHPRAGAGRALCACGCIWCIWADLVEDTRLMITSQQERNLPCFTSTMTLSSLPRNACSLRTNHGTLPTKNRLISSSLSASATPQPPPPRSRLACLAQRERPQRRESMPVECRREHYREPRGTRRGSRHWSGRH